MRVLVTGSEGFIGKNLCVSLSRSSGVEILRFSKENTLEELPGLVEKSDFIFHLAGVNRPKDDTEFFSGNSDLTES